jgi:hypothetical protein
LANTSSARSAPTAAIQPANAQSSISLTVARMERVVDLIEARLKRLEHSHSSLRRRIVADKAEAS